MRRRGKAKVSFHHPNRLAGQRLRLIVRVGHPAFPAAAAYYHGLRMNAVVGWAKSSALSVPRRRRAYDFADASRVLPAQCPPYIDPTCDPKCRPRKIAMQWRDQVALVTGSARGIGRATARRLAQHGAAVCVNYAAHTAAANEVVAEITKAGGRAIAAAADVADAATVEAMVARTE